MCGSGLFSMWWARREKQEALLPSLQVQAWNCTRRTEDLHPGRWNILDSLFVGQGKGVHDKGHLAVWFLPGQETREEGPEASAVGGIGAAWSGGCGASVWDAGHGSRRRLHKLPKGTALGLQSANILVTHWIFSRALDQPARGSFRPSRCTVSFLPLFKSSSVLLATPDPCLQPGNQHLGGNCNKAF